MCRKNSTYQKRSLVEVWKRLFWQSKLTLGFASLWFLKFDKASFLVRRVFSTHFDKCYAYEKKFTGSKESLSTTKRIIRHVEMIIRQERAIFVGFKEIISWQSQESISTVKKSLFQTSTRLLFWHVEFFLHIFHRGYERLCIWKIILSV